MSSLSYDVLSLRLERSLTLSELGTIRKMVPIQECGQPLVDLPQDIFSFEMPHPYQAAGASYGSYGPFYVREEVLRRLLVANEKLQEKQPGCRLHIFDAYRPLTVQSYMVSVTRAQVAEDMGFSLVSLTEQQEQLVMSEVFKLWAKPSNDPTQPPPHSTGGAIDLSIVNADGQLFEMGSEFDELSERILPSYYREDRSQQGQRIQENRECLREVMVSAGFMRLSHEWWHFSFGDQMWALLKHLVHLEPQAEAHYGAVI